MSIYNTPLEERFGEKLEELREGKNMTREQLAEQVGLTARHIAALERGERRPTLNTMEKLLRTLGAPTEWLIYPEFEEQKCPLARDIPFGCHIFGRAAGIPARYDAPDAETEIWGLKIAVFAGTPLFLCIYVLNNRSSDTLSELSI